MRHTLLIRQDGSGRWVGHSDQRPDIRAEGRSAKVAETKLRRLLRRADPEAEFVVDLPPQPTITVHLRHAGRGWVATTPDDTTLEAKGVTTRSAKMKITNLIALRYGAGAAVAFQFFFPPEYEERLQAMRAQEAELRGLSAALPQQRLELAADLIRHTACTQTDAAEVMGMSQSSLAMAMKRDSDAAARTASRRQIDGAASRR